MVDEDKMVCCWRGGMIVKLPFCQIILLDSL